MMRMGTTAVALMAGGKSMRMGRDKACLPDRNGKFLWVGRLELLRQIATSEVLISCREEQGYLEESGARLVYDRWLDAGPLGGIVSCLEAMQAERLLVLAVDMPAMTRDALEWLLKAAGHGGAVFRCGGFLEPLVAVYPKGMSAYGRQRLDAGEFALKGWIAEAGETMRVVEAPEEWAELFINVNDPAKWEQWMEACRKSD